MRSVRIAIIEDKARIQKKTFEVRERDDGKYELNLIWPASYNYGAFDSKIACKKNAESICVLGIHVTNITL